MDKEIPQEIIDKINEAANKEEIYPKKYGSGTREGYNTMMLYEINSERSECFERGAYFGYELATSPESLRYHGILPEIGCETKAAIYLEECHISGDTMINMNHSLDEVPEEERGAYYLHDLLAQFAARYHQSPVSEENRKLKLFSSYLLKSYDDMVDKFSSEVSLGLEYVKEILGPRNAMESVLKETMPVEQPSSLREQKKE